MTTNLTYSSLSSLLNITFALSFLRPPVIDFFLFEPLVTPTALCKRAYFSSRYFVSFKSTLGLGPEDGGTLEFI